MTTAAPLILTDTITGIHSCATWFQVPRDAQGSRQECRHGFTRSTALAREGKTMTSVGERRC